MEACLADSLVSEISPSYYFLIKIIMYLYGLVGWPGW